MPSTSGSQPPENSLSRLALKKAASMMPKKMVIPSASGSGQRQLTRATTKNSKVVISMVPVTAMP